MLVSFDFRFNTQGDSSPLWHKKKKIRVVDRNPGTIQMRCLFTLLSTNFTCVTVKLKVSFNRYKNTGVENN